MFGEVKFLVNKPKGGIERVDVETGQVVIRHPFTGVLNIRNFPKEVAERISLWHEGRKANSRNAALIHDALPDLSADDREELLSGLPGKEFDETFKDDDDDTDPNEKAF